MPLGKKDDDISLEQLSHKFYGQIFDVQPDKSRRLHYGEVEHCSGWAIFI